MKVEDFSEELIGLNKKVTAIQNAADANKNKLIRDYAFENKLFNIGDVIIASGDAILVDDIKYSSGYKTQRLRGTDTLKQTVSPYCIYYGKVLTKKMALRKDGKRSVVSGLDFPCKIDKVIK